METKISTTDEKHLTRAIEKAATIATVNDSLDRNELLAKQLLSEGVDSRFAKVASAAFNKRITVLTFQKTADEHRSEPFALTDDAKVFELMGGEAQTKTASQATPIFKIQTYTAAAPMSKTASVGLSKPRYEHTVDCDTYKMHVESMIEKQAAEFSQITGMYESLQSKVKEDAETLAQYFQKSACSSFEFTTAVNCFGDDIKEALGEYLPATTDFTKTASAVMPNTYVFQKLATLIKESKAVKSFEDFIGYYGKGLAEFSKSAGMLGDFMAKAEYHGLTKKALSASSIGAPLAMIGRGAVIQALNAKNDLQDIAENTGNAYRVGINNAMNMYNAGNVIGMAPNDVLDAEFLIKERLRDRLMGWSDMSADPQFAMYPAAQVFAATQKAMDTDTSLERPDRREVLRTTVGQLLAQNNRFSTADVAALATTLQNLTGTGGNAAGVAATGVSSDKVTAPEKPAMESIADVLPRKRTDINALMSAHINAIANARKRREDELEAQERAKEKAETEAKEKQRSEEDKQERDARLKADADERRQAASDYQAFQAREHQKDRDAAEAAAARSDKTYRQALAIQARLARKGLGSFSLPQPPSTPSFDTSSKDQNTGGSGSNGGDSGGNGNGLGGWTSKWESSFDHAAQLEAKKTGESIQEVTDRWNQEKGNQVRREQQARAEGRK